MADASQPFTFVIPAGNGSNTLITNQMSLGLAEVNRIILTWPAGCSGLVGVSIYAANSPAFPVKAGQYWAYDDYVYDFTVTNQIQTGQWSMVAYNLDYFPHTIQCVMEYDYVVSDVLANASLQVSL